MQISPRRLLPLFLLIVVAVPSVAQNSAAFNSFYTKFQAAVASQDQGALTSLMSSSFDFMQSQNVAPADVFTGLSDNNGLQWTNLQETATRTPVNYPPGPSGRQRKVVQCMPTQIIYNCLVVFEKNSAGKWRWRGMTMLEK